MKIDINHDLSFYFPFLDHDDFEPRGERERKKEREKEREKWDDAALVRGKRK